MNLFQKQQTTSGYASIPNAIADNETATVPLGTTIVPRPATTTMTSGHRAKLWMAIAAGLLLVTGVVVLRDRETAAEGLIVVAIIFVVTSLSLTPLLAASTSSLLSLGLFISSLLVNILRSGKGRRERVRCVEGG